MELNKKTFLQCNSGRLLLPPSECGRSAVPSLGVPATDIVTDPDKPSSLPLSLSSCSHFSKLSSPLFSSQMNGDSAGKAHTGMFIQVASKCLSVLALCHWLYQCRPAPPSILTMLLFAFKRRNRHNWGMTWFPEVSRKNVWLSQRRWCVPTANLKLTTVVCTASHE